MCGAILLWINSTVILLTMNNRIKWLSVFLRKLIRSKQMILLSAYIYIYIYIYRHTHTTWNGRRPSMIRPRGVWQWIINLMWGHNPPSKWEKPPLASCYGAVPHMDTPCHWNGEWIRSMVNDANFHCIQKGVQ